MSSNSAIQRAVRLAVVMSALPASLHSVTAFAQQPADTKALEEVVVTGSRIVNPNLTSASPVAQVTAQDVERQGVTRVEDLINQLPQAFAAQNATVANGASGTATVNLRALGSARTLVLIDGRRMPYGGVTNSAADLNQIPTEMVERVEVLTGGASAVYGSDAVAGVVNFIMKKNFTGVEVNAQYGFYNHSNSFGGPGAVKLRDRIAARAATNPAQFKLPDSTVNDGYSKQASILVGVTSEDGRANFTAYAGWRENDAILQANRDFSACTLATAAPTVSFACGGSGTAYPGTFTPDFVTSYTVQGSGAAAIFRPFSSATDQYNFGPLNHFQRPDTRYNIGAMGHFELNPHADIYMQLMFSDYRSVAQIAPGGAFFDTSTINCDNPLMTAQQRTTLGCTPAFIAAGTSVPLYIGRRNVEGGGRQQDFHNNSFRAVVGTRGEISDGWSYDASAQFSRVTATQKTLNYFVIDRIARALDVVAGPGGVPTCRSVIDGTDPGCVPYNVFSVGGVTQAALDYLQAPGLQQGTIDQEIWNLAITGDLGKYGVQLPTASSGLQVAFGAEYRRDSLENETDSLLATAALSGTGGATIGIRGATQVKDLFFEGNLPLVEDKAFAKELGLETAYRFSDYGNESTNTYKLGLTWSPIDSIRLRGSYQRAIRAANIVELFTAQGFNLFDLTGDPCGAAHRNANATAAKCIATGVPAANVGSVALDSPAGQYNFLQGGNPNLKPEESTTKTIGVVLTPDFAPGMSLALDYFDIKIDGTISTFGAENTLDACYNNNDPASCARIVRNPANGTLWVGSGHVEDLNINIGSLETSGIDLNFNYNRVNIGSFGSLNFNVTATYLDKLLTDPGPGIASYDCVGYFASKCGTPKPKVRGQSRVGWKTPWKDLDVDLTWRYIGSVDMFGAAAGRIDSAFSAENYFDISASMPLFDKYEVRLGILNVLDNDPQLNASVGTTGNGNTYPQTYDALGRFLFVGVKAKF